MSQYVPDGMSVAALEEDIRNGGRFVFFQYTISIIVLTFKRSSGIQYIPAGKSSALKGLPYTLISLVLGWWGLPWGPIYTIGSLATNIGGGKDVTNEVLPALQAATLGSNIREAVEA
jgi:hypothetical protein